ncbi:MAG: hypothetical protein J6D28_00400 [Bacilli bacterium]|nr:hypothetical protein [Bacilli bacterium]
MDCSKLSELGNEYYENGQFDKSIECYKKILEITDDKYYKEHIFERILQIYFYNMNNTDKTLQFYTKAGEFGINKYAGHMSHLICVALAKENRFDEALNYCNEYYSFNNNDIETIEDIVSDFLENYIKSDKSAIDRIISADYPFVYWELGNIYYRNEETQDVSLALDYWSKGTSKSRRCVLNLIEHYSSNCEYDKALEHARIGYKYNLPINDGNDVSNVIRIILSNYDKFTKEQINKIKDIILSSKELLFVLSLEYKDGYYTQEKKPNIEKFLYYCELSASKGYSRANKTLADTYYDGEIVEKNYVRALYYYEKVYKAENNIDMNAINILKYIIEEDKGELLTKINTETLDEFASMLIDKGELLAKFNTETLDKFASILIDKGELLAKFNTETLDDIAVMLINEGNKCDDCNNQNKCYKMAYAISPNYNEALKYAYGEGQEIDYKQLFECFDERKTVYFKNIKEKIESGAEVIKVNNISDLTFDQLNDLPDDTIISINSLRNLLYHLSLDFYMLSDIKTIIRVCNKLLEGIDLIQNQEDIFMQIYIKLANMISYDHKAAKRQDDDRAHNLITLLRKEGVCHGYAVVLMNVLSMVGIESNVLNSVYYNHESHVYNQVKINDIWYNCDLTWDSNNIKKGNIKYCLQSKSNFRNRKNGKWHQPIDESLEHEANENYSHIKILFYRNYIKLFKKDPLGMIKDRIVESPLKDEEIKQVKGAIK